MRTQAFSRLGEGSVVKGGMRVGPLKVLGAQPCHPLGPLC